MSKPKSGPSYDSHRLTDCLEAQAHLCERIARRCAGEESGGKYLKLAQECKEAAALEKARQTEKPIKAEWPAVVLF